MTRRHGISVPQRNITSLQRTTSQLKEATEYLLGYRGAAAVGRSGAAAPPTLDLTELTEYLLALEARVEALEAHQSIQDVVLNFLLDGTHAFGFQSVRYRHSPSNSPNNSARVSFDTVTALSNITHPNSFSFSPSYEGDFTVFVRLNFEADSSGDEWRLQAYQNGSPIGRTFEFKPDEIGGGVFADFFLQAAGYFNVGDDIDIRLWPKDSGKRGYIESFTYQMVGLGLVDPQFSPWT